MTAGPGTSGSATRCQTRPMASSGGAAAHGGPVRFILASASPARLHLLRQVGIQPDRVVSGVDEACDGPAAEVASQLARRKAQAVAERTEGDALVLGCDSVLEHSGRVLGKPSSADDAQARWHELRGTTGRLHTGHCLMSVTHGQALRRVEAGAVTTVRFGTPSDDEVAAYVATGEPLQVAGGFTIDGLGGGFIDGVDGCHSNVIGLSLPVLRRLVNQLGLSVCDWW